MTHHPAALNHPRKAENKGTSSASALGRPAIRALLGCKGHTGSRISCPPYFPGIASRSDDRSIEPVSYWGSQPERGGAMGGKERYEEKFLLIMDRAREIFAEKGYHSASIRDVAAATETSPGSDSPGSLQG